MEKAWNILKDILVFLITIVAAAIMLFTFISVPTFNKPDQDFLGYKAFVVLSDSMSATDFDSGDLVIVKKADPSTLREGDIIAYISQSSYNKGEVVTHKIRSLTTYKGQPAFITYGTTTNMDDDLPVTYEFVVGKYETALPKVGHFFQFFRTLPGYCVCILLPFSIIIFMQWIDCMALFRSHNSEHLMFDKSNFTRSKRIAPKVRYRG